MQSQSSSADHPVTSIAVDFGGTKISAARISRNRIVERKRVETDQSASPEHHAATIIELIESLNDNEVARMGVAVCGRVDSEGNWHALNNNTLKSFSSFPLRDHLHSHFGGSVNVMNDATAAAWGEYCRRAADADIESLLYVTVSTGVGGGVVLRGKPVTSVNGLATHFGFMKSSFGNELCGSGRTGTLESIASGTAIGRYGSSGLGEELTGLDVYRRHLEGDSIATAAVDRSAHAIAQAIADVRALLGIQLVSIGGSVGLDDGYVPLVQRYIDEEPELFRPTVMPAQFGKDSALFGVIIPQE